MQQQSQSGFDSKRDAMMCRRGSPFYKKCLFTNMLSNQLDNGSFKISGVVKYDLAAISAMKKLYLKYWAAAPPDYLTSFSGSGLPFANEDIAMENTPSFGVVPLQDGKYDFIINYPNAYYRELGTEYVPPSVYLQVSDELNNTVTPVYRFQIDNGIPARRIEMFSNNQGLNRGPIRSQAEMLKRKGYPERN